MRFQHSPSSSELVIKKKNKGGKVKKNAQGK